ncbi:hypothetical protein D9M70_457480 [compost metagenome]
MPTTKEILLSKYRPRDLAPVEVNKTADIASVQLVMSVDDFSEAEILKACVEFNKAHRELQAYSFTLLADYTLPTGHVLKAGSWVFNVGGGQ